MIEMAKPIIGQDEIDAVVEVLLSGNITNGPKVQEFENSFSSLLNNRHCIAVNSGTSALILAILSLNLKKGDEVIVPSFSFAASANSIALSGATPIFADIDINNFCIDINHVESLIGPRTKAIMPVHLFGQSSNMDELVSIAKRNNLFIIEDAAQAHLATWNKKPLGTFGDVACFSFYATKNMTTAEGGMVVTSDSDVARKVKMLRNQGMEVKYDNELIGFNNRMTDINAALGLAQLKKLNTWTEIRKNIANFYDQHLKGVVTPSVDKLAGHAYHQYTIRVSPNLRDELKQQLSNDGIESAIFYPRPIHKLRSFNLDIDLPNTEIACKTVLSLPIHPLLTRNDTSHVVESVNRVMN
jgi:perosamine synthetase